ncbi:hypothetical protein L6164_011315 [Bauhinia variegata]|uniref:Uncharacterized protein n=1 Tax=Bauhinia variegata TaxID=167791 RepID=A0ACB9P5I1_BAUVA|nr:hypothetical protein L6164_011315 [Bauhinia variegata]
MVLILTYYFALLLTISRTHSTSAAPSFEPLLSIPSQSVPQRQCLAVFLRLGTPVQIILVTVDTGNHFPWSQCQPCSKCHPRFHPLFDPRRLSTMRDLTCDSDTCMIPEMKRIFTNYYKGSCNYDVKYSEQSYSSGRVVTDTLTFTHSDTEVKDFVMGCGDYHEGQLRVHFSGVFGLGRSPLSVQSQLNAKAFSLCLVRPISDKPTTLDFYEFPPKQNQYDSNPIMVPLRVWGYGLNYDGGVVIDTGSTIMQLPSDAYRVVSSEISRTIRNLAYKAGHKGLGLEFCYADDPSNVYPTVELYFENGSSEGERFVSLKLGTEQILYRPERGVVCRGHYLHMIWPTIS